mmetsp:Transcript_32093/g.53031  ORF Transcript_32093/g.53031 Transcript_32093/m.53031 type:complete len:208 (+) Transcript_32093:716-1339(+)
MQELCDNVFAKGKGDTSVVLTPSVNLLVGIGPQEITEKTSVRNISWANDTFYLIETCQLRTETTVHAKDLLVNDGGAWKTVEAVGKRLPQLDSESSLALVIKAVDAIDGSTLVVTTEHEKVLRILDFVSKEKANCFQRLLATVHVITQKHIIGFRREASVFKETQQIIVLPVDITTDLDRRFEFEKHGLANQKVTTTKTEHFDFCLR